MILKSWLTILEVDFEKICRLSGWWAVFRRFRRLHGVLWYDIHLIILDPSVDWRKNPIMIMGKPLGGRNNTLVSGVFRNAYSFLAIHGILYFRLTMHPGSVPTNRWTYDLNHLRSGVLARPVVSGKECGGSWFLVCFCIEWVTLVNGVIPTW